MIAVITIIHLVKRSIDAFTRSLSRLESSSKKIANTRNDNLDAESCASISSSSDNSRKSLLLYDIGIAILVMCIIGTRHVAYGICSLIILRDEVRVDVHCEARRGMPEALLHGLNIGTGFDEQRRLGVPQLVEVESNVATLLNALAAPRIRVGGFLGKFVEPMIDEILAPRWLKVLGLANLKIPLVQTGGFVLLPYAMGFHLSFGFPVLEEGCGSVVDAEKVLLYYRIAEREFGGAMENGFGYYRRNCDICRDALKRLVRANLDDWMPYCLELKFDGAIRPMSSATIVVERGKDGGVEITVEQVEIERNGE